MNTYRVKAFKADNTESVEVFKAKNDTKANEYARKNYATRPLVEMFMVHEVLNNDQLRML